MEEGHEQDGDERSHTFDSAGGAIDAIFASS